MKPRWAVPEGRLPLRHRRCRLWLAIAWSAVQRRLPTGARYLVSAGSNRALWTASPNAMSQSTIGLKGACEVLPELNAVSRLKPASIRCPVNLPVKKDQCTRTAAFRRTYGRRTPIRAATATPSTVVAGVEWSRKWRPPEILGRSRHRPALPSSKACLIQCPAA
jgi:hypothetical protein